MGQNWGVIASAINNVTRAHFEFSHVTPLAGGCINQTYRITSQNQQHFFVKLNTADKHAMFDAERKGLSAIAATHTIRVPQPITDGIAGVCAFLVLENIDLIACGNEAFLGQQLAAMHRHCGQQFGFALSNTIGATPQQNNWHTDWINFWREQRLGFQLELAAHHGYGGKLQLLGQMLMERLPEFFVDYQPAVSLLHGDLWGGNHAYAPGGVPVIFDPAPYYGDRETDLAMTELFGGFGPEFYAAYRAAWPLHAGYTQRKTLYNLYHVLNHANHFGGGYARQAESMMKVLLQTPA